MRPDDKGDLVVKRENQYPMGIDLAGGTELIYVLNYDQTLRDMASTQATIAEVKKSISEKSSQDPNFTGKKELEDKIHKLNDALDAQKRSIESAPDKAAEVLRHRVDPNGTKGIPVTTFGNNRERLRIQLPKASTAEIERIKTAIKTQGRLSFDICNRRPRNHRSRRPRAGRRQR